VDLVGARREDLEPVEPRRGREANVVADEPLERGTEVESGREVQRVERSETGRVDAFRPIDQIVGDRPQAKAAEQPAHRLGPLADEPAR
jgi:hypothetical protein